jgi:hypothetical protein
VLDHFEAHGLDQSGGGAGVPTEEDEALGQKYLTAAPLLAGAVFRTKSQPTDRR